MIRPAQTVNSSYLIRYFALTRTEENIRALLVAHRFAIRTGFYAAIRAQMELNALLLHFTQNTDYASDFLNRLEDRKQFKDHPELIKNIQTLLEKLIKGYPQYLGKYDDLSNLLHPNPSAVVTSNEIGPTNDGHASWKRPDIFFTDTWLRHSESQGEAAGWADFMITQCKDLCSIFDVFAKDKNLLEDRTVTLHHLLERTMKTILEKEKT